jgi:hypothetical protein
MQRETSRKARGHRIAPAAICVLAGLASASAEACATTHKGDSFTTGTNLDDGGDDSSSATGGTRTSGPSSGTSSGSGGGFGDLSSEGGAGHDDAGDAGAQACTDAGCSCIRIASIGHEGIWGACGQGGGDGTSALVDWLNTQSTATVDRYDQSKPTLTADFLKPYNVIILQWLRDVSDAGNDGALWQFSPSEVSALSQWVEAGGGLITLSGYDGDSQEVVPSNTLLSFTAFAYNMDGTNGSDWAGGSCWGGASGLTGWNMASPIGAHITEVGVANGRSINVAADAGAVTVDCPCPGQNDCAVHQDIGKGHVFSFTDEWVTYTSQWNGMSSCLSASCTNTPGTAFQVPQFWYNAIRYAASSATCFRIDNPKIVY